MNLKLEPAANNEKIENNINTDIKKEKLFKILGIVTVIIVICLIILFIVSLFFQGKKSYIQVEEIMKNAAIKYYQEHKGKLPTEENKNVLISDNTLINNKYMKPFDKYFGKDNKCSGRVEVDYNSGKYLYTAYLNCGEKYTTLELYNKLKEKIVTTGNGLYIINNEYVFRGDKVNNYISLGENDIWRIVKITANGEIVIIKDGQIIISKPWDDRYNALQKFNSGINDYSVSRIKDSLAEEYTSKKYLSNNKKYLVEYEACIGRRPSNYNASDNSVECSLKEKTYISLLTTSDYLNASLDTNCNNALSKSCQNYNYLKNKQDWWLLTASTVESNQVYMVKTSGYLSLEYPSNYYFVRPVHHLNSKVMYKSGTGTIDTPYIIR